MTKSPVLAEGAEDTGAEVAASEELAGEAVEIGEVLHGLGRQELVADLPDGFQVSPEADGQDGAGRVDEARGPLLFSGSEGGEGVGDALVGDVEGEGRGQAVVGPGERGGGPFAGAEQLQPVAEQEGAASVGLVAAELLGVDGAKGVEADVGEGQSVGGERGLLLRPGIDGRQLFKPFGPALGAVDDGLEGVCAVGDDQAAVEDGVGFLGADAVAGHAFIGFFLDGIRLALVAGVGSGEFQEAVVGLFEQGGVFGGDDQE